VVVVLLLLCGGATAVVWWAKDKVPTSNTGAAPTTGAAPSASTPSPSPSPSPELVTRLSEPATLGGKPRLKTTALEKAAGQLRTQMKSVMPGSADTVAAFYGNIAKQDMLMIFGSTAPIPDPKVGLDALFSGMGSSMSVKNETDIPAGPLGGVARCGNGESDGIKLGVCGWSDEGSVGMIVIYFKDFNQLRSQFAEYRGQIETRS
jgi:hypothetical protein